jgi:hypothetical protein
MPALMAAVFLGAKFFGGLHWEWLSACLPGFVITRFELGGHIEESAGKYRRKSRVSHSRMFLYSESFNMPGTSLLAPFEIEGKEGFRSSGSAKFIDDESLSSDLLFRDYR